MEFVFEVTEKTGRKIHLSRERWRHITTKHPNMSNKLEEIKEALINPLLIIPHKFDDTMRNYYIYYKLKKDYLLISVKYLNGGGYVSTAFITRKIRRR